ncbi:MAG: prohibitin family protein [Limisphaerales bacterium]
MSTRRTYPPGGRPPAEITVNPLFLPRLIAVGVVVFALVVVASTGTYLVEPGTRGIKVTLGKASDQFLPEGFGFKAPFLTTIVPVNVRQKTMPVRAECFSSDLQQVTLDLRVLYRVPEESVVQIYKQYAGDPFDSLIAPRVQEALKEVTALLTAEQIVKKREEVKLKALAAARQKIGDILRVEDIVIRSIDLSSELERAIEAKMVAEQQAAQARFTQLQTQVEAETAVITAKGEAEAIRVRGDALKMNPAFLRLKIVERWNGKSPLVVPADPHNTGAGLLLPLGPEAGVAP